MTEDMSMFKKMKDKITDEVNSATNKLQSMQIIDQLASSIGQQVLNNDSMPHQKLPDLSEQAALPTNSRFSLIDDNPLGVCEGDDELNSEVSPQHQLFNERFIRRLRSPKNTSRSNNGSGTILASSIESDNQHSVIDINQLSSDIEEDFGDIHANDDGEIDLLSDKVVPLADSLKHDDGNLSLERLATYKTRYREVVHALRRINDDHRLERFQLESDTKRLTDQISVLQEELHNVKLQSQQNNSLLSNHDSERKSNSGSPHQPVKQANKIKDLEKLMAKCKESLKAKNAQLKILKNAMIEVEKFSDNLNELKDELKELKNAHETWSLSLAESKRVMHQEIEEKNVEMDSIKSQLKDCSTRLLQQKSNIQNLESRLVSMSAAHQKERESLIKDLTNAKNSAIKRLQKEHDLQLERVRLDLEKSIEALKSDILARDEQIIRSGQKQQELEKQNCNLRTDLESHKKMCEDQLVELKGLQGEKERCAVEIEELKNKIEELDKPSSEDADLKLKNVDLQQRNQELEQTVLLLSEDLTKFKDDRLVELKELQAEKGRCAVEIEELKNKIEELDKPSSEFADLKSKNVELQQRNQELEQTVLLLSEDLTQFKNDRLVESIGLQAEKERCANEIEELKNKIEELNKRSSENADLKSKNVDLQQRIQELEQKVLLSSEDLTKFKDANEELSQKLNDISTNTSQADIQQSCTRCLEYQAELGKGIALSEEKAREVVSSIEEVERLRTENQALIHDQKAYDDQIAILDNEIQSLKGQLATLESNRNGMVEASTETEMEKTDPSADLTSKDTEILELKRLINESDQFKSQVDKEAIPSSTEFEYLKNIVYQFLMGREPVTLARVISAIFKFDTEQMEQICKFQEAIHQM